MTTFLLRGFGATATVALLFTSLAFAQQGGNQQDWQSQQDWQEQQGWQNQGNQNQQGWQSTQNQQGWQSSSNQQGWSNQGQNPTLDRWVRVAYDYDGDGRWDAVEYLFGYDLDQARRSSQQRQQQLQQQGYGGQQGWTGAQSQGWSNQGPQNQGWSQQNPWSQQNQSQRGGQNQGWNQQGWSNPGQANGWSNGQQNRFAARQHQLNGTIQSLETRRYIGVSQPHLFARVDVDGRTARVDLGPKDQVSDLDLQEGDHVSMVGRRGTINGQGVFVAEQIDNGNGSGSVGVQRQHTNLRLLDGTLTAMHQAHFQEDDADHTLALLQRGGGGNPVLVDLGPTDQLQDLDLQQGDYVTLLAATGKIENRDALIAESISTAGNATVALQRQGGQISESRAARPSR